MRIFCNEEEMELPDGATVLGLCSALGADPRHVVVAVDDGIVPGRSFAEHDLSEGSRVEIMVFVGGG